MRSEWDLNREFHLEGPAFQPLGLFPEGSLVSWWDKEVVGEKKEQLTRGGRRERGKKEERVKHDPVCKTARRERKRERDSSGLVVYYYVVLFPVAALLYSYLSIYSHVAAKGKSLEC